MVVTTAQFDLMILWHAGRAHVNIRTYFADKTRTVKLILVADIATDLMDGAAFFIQSCDLLLEADASLVELL